MERGIFDGLDLLLVVLAAALAAYALSIRLKLSVLNEYVRILERSYLEDVDDISALVDRLNRENVAAPR